MRTLIFIVGSSPTAEEIELAKENNTMAFRTLLESPYPVEEHDLALAIDMAKVPEGYVTEIRQDATKESEGGAPEGSGDNAPEGSEDATGNQNPPPAPNAGGPAWLQNRQNAGGLPGQVAV